MEKGTHARTHTHTHTTGVPPLEAVLGTAHWGPRALMRVSPGLQRCPPRATGAPELGSKSARMLGFPLPSLLGLQLIRRRSPCLTGKPRNSCVFNQEYAVKIERIPLQQNSACFWSPLEPTLKGWPPEKQKQLVSIYGGLPFGW